jgi:hypothetical protein
MHAEFWWENLLETVRFENWNEYDTELGLRNRILITWFALTLLRLMYSGGILLGILNLLFVVCSLFNDASSKTQTIRSNEPIILEWWIGNDVGGGRGLMKVYYPGICLEGLRKTAENLSQNSRSPGRDLNPGPP